jgi:uncharacterized protein
MAKAPNAGRVKTRLSPPLSPQESRDLGSCFLTDMTANLALAAQQAPVDAYVAFAPAGSEADFGPILAPGTALVLADGSCDAPSTVAGIGRSLLQAARTLLGRGYGAVILLNSDSPTLPTALLVKAVCRLLVARDRVVLGPCLDGGYYLIGMRHPHAEMFASIDWSTEHVAEQTRQRAGARRLELLELDSWYDIDDVNALRRLINELAAPSTRTTPVYPASVTRAFLEQTAIADRLGMRGLLTGSLLASGSAAVAAQIAGGAEPSG